MALKLPEGVIAMQQLSALRAGKAQNVVGALEHKLDEGLVWGYDLFNHPLRDFLGPVWGFDVYPGFEKYAVRLADYRNKNPHPRRSDEQAKGPSEGSAEEAEKRALLEYGAAVYEHQLKVMVERYANRSSRQAPNPSLERTRRQAGSFSATRRWRRSAQLQR